MASDSHPSAGVSRDLAFSGWLDLFRAAAAFAVVYSHARPLFMVSAVDGQVLTPLSRALYLLSGYGHQAVMVFFVLSGYLVGGTVLRSVRDGRWSWRKYLTQRGTRLYVVLLPALVLTLCWDWGEQRLSAGQVANDDTAVANIRSETIREHTSLTTFVGNVAFLQTVAVPSLGSNTPLWSLANEFWYYLVFPVGWLAVAGRNIAWWKRTVFLAVSAITLCLLGTKIAVYFPIWLLGVLVAGLPESTIIQRKAVRRTLSLIALVGLAGLMAVVGLGKLKNELLSDYLIGFVFAVLVYALKHSRRPAASPTARRWVGGFADFSYTLYLVHLPPLICLRAWLTYESAWVPDATAWLKLALIVAAVVGYAYLLSLVTERQTERVRRWIDSLGSQSGVMSRRLTPGGGPLDDPSAPHRRRLIRPRTRRV